MTLSNPSESGRIGPPFCVNNSSPLGLANCHLINTPTTTESTPPDQTKSITDSKTVTKIESDQIKPITNSESRGIDVPIVIAVIVAVVIVFISVTSVGVIVVLMVYRRSRNSTTRNAYNTNKAAVHTSNVTIDLAQNAAYGVTTETQRNREVFVMSENATYGAAPLSGQQQSPHEVEPPYHNIIM